MSPENRHVYFLQVVGGGPIKIGCSELPENRLKELAKWCPLDLVLLARMRGGYAVERALHRKFESSRIKWEWFHPAEELVALIQRAVAKGGFDDDLPDDISFIDDCPRRHWMVSALGARLRQTGITIEQLAADTGITQKKLRSYKYTGIPDCHIGNILSAFSKRGHPLTCADLFREHNPRPRQHVSAAQ